MSFVPLGGSKDPVAYCHLHKFTLSRNQMRRKKCLEKQCKRLQKFENHPYWKERAKRKALAKARREEKKNAKR